MEPMILLLLVIAFFVGLFFVVRAVAESVNEQAPDDPTPLPHEPERDQRADVARMGMATALMVGAMVGAAALAAHRARAYAPAAQRIWTFARAEWRRSEQQLV
jgi:hypothetical protein